MLKDAKRNATIHALSEKIKTETIKLFVSLGLVTGMIAAIVGMNIAEMSFEENGMGWLFVIMLLIIGSCWVLISLIQRNELVQKRKMAKRDIEQYERTERYNSEEEVIKRERLSVEYTNEHGAPWERKYYSFPCPYCGHYRVRPAKWDDKKIDVAFWGAYASTKLTDHYRCDHCKKMWK